MNASVDPATSVRRIAVFSDTHDGYPPELPGWVAAADELWHLGDVCEPAVLREFEALGKPLLVVSGNNDDFAAWPFTRSLERGGRRFHLEHIAPHIAPAGAEFVLSGHTHVPADVTTPDGVRWLNPGCIRFPRAGVRSFAWLTVTAAGAVGWEIVAW